MIENREKLIDFAKIFIAICNKENIWYSLDKNTLKGSIKHGGFVPWKQRFDVMITMNGYKKLKRLYPNKLVDSFIDKKYKNLTVSFIKNNKDWTSPQPFINIRILVPSTTKKIKNFSSLIFKIKNLLYLRFDNIKHAINDLYEPNNYEGFYLLEKRKYFKKNNWIQTMTMKRVIVNFSKIKVKVLKEYDDVLKYWYGKEYLNITSVPSIWYNYKSPLIKEREGK